MICFLSSMAMLLVGVVLGILGVKLSKPKLGKKERKDALR